VTTPAALDTDGSSPRMWGTLPHLQPPIASNRFIPTHVGNTTQGLPGSFQAPVHPHACGEHEVADGAIDYAHGSSPRMWGTRHKDVYAPRAIRFIPTHVGNTPRTSRSRRLPAVHPHACGEHNNAGDFCRHLAGSSPRMWGTLSCNIDKVLVARFIPTHVGNTIWDPGVLQISPVHPHACGEHPFRRSG